jgi:hypothetical protein
VFERGKVEKFPTNYSLAAGATSNYGNPESAYSIALIATAAIHTDSRTK